MPWNRTVIYECHVKGMTVLHPDVPEELRGTYLGLAPTRSSTTCSASASPRSSCCPCTSSSPRSTSSSAASPTTGATTRSASSRPTRATRPRPTGEQVAEFKTMVKRLHRAGIEVILDVVYNHTGEGNHLGPTLSLRGIDNAAYYRLRPDDRRHYVDFTGCGNSLNMPHPRTIQLIMDSLRYWVHEMHVDGFRFDLAPALARELYDVNRLGTLLRHHPPGSGAVAGEAHRRALGPRARRLPGRATSRSAGRSGTASTATACGASGAATPDTSPSSPRASPARATSTRRATARRTRASTS